MKNQKKIGAVIAVIALLGIATWVVRLNTEPTGGPSSSGTRKPAPLFELKDFSGKMHRLEEFKGQPMVVHFWASWCPPCLNEISEWIEFTKKLQGKPIGFVAISLDKSWDDAQKILNDQQLPPNVISLLDVEGKVADQYGSYQYPETYILNSKHEIFVKLVGPQKWSMPEFSDRLVEILLKK